MRIDPFTLGISQSRQMEICLLSFNFLLSPIRIVHLRGMHNFSGWINTPRASVYMRFFIHLPPISDNSLQFIGLTQCVLTLCGFRYTPHHSEIIVLLASLSTCDPGDIYQTIHSLANNRIRCSVISLAVEVFVYRALAQLTQGK